jgi:hypothetical protein
MNGFNFGANTDKDKAITAPPNLTVHAFTSPTDIGGGFGFGGAADKDKDKLTTTGFASGDDKEITTATIPNAFLPPTSEIKLSFGGDIPSGKDQSSKGLIINFGREEGNQSKSEKEVKKNYVPVDRELKVFDNEILEILEKSSIEYCNEESLAGYLKKGKNLIPNLLEIQQNILDEKEEKKPDSKNDELINSFIIVLSRTLNLEVDIAQELWWDYMIQGRAKDSENGNLKSFYVLESVVDFFFNQHQFSWYLVQELLRIDDINNRDHVFYFVSKDCVNTLVDNDVTEKLMNYLEWLYFKWNVFDLNKKEFTSFSYGNRANQSDFAQFNHKNKIKWCEFINREIKLVLDTLIFTVQRNKRLSVKLFEKLLRISCDASFTIPDVCFNVLDKDNEFLKQKLQIELTYTVLFTECLYFYDYSYDNKDTTLSINHSSKDDLKYINEIIDSFATIKPNIQHNDTRSGIVSVITLFWGLFIRKWNKSEVSSLQNNENFKNILENSLPYLYDLIKIGFEINVSSSVIDYNDSDKVNSTDRFCSILQEPVQLIIGTFLSNTNDLSSIMDIVTNLVYYTYRSNESLCSKFWDNFYNELDSMEELGDNYSNESSDELYKLIKYLQENNLLETKHLFVLLNSIASTSESCNLIMSHILEKRVNMPSIIDTSLLISTDGSPVGVNPILRGSKVLLNHRIESKNFFGEVVGLEIYDLSLPKPGDVGTIKHDYNGQKVYIEWDDNYCKWWTVFIDKVYSSKWSKEIFTNDEYDEHIKTEEFESNIAALDLFSKLLHMSSFNTMLLFESKVKEIFLFYFLNNIHTELAGMFFNEKSLINIIFFDFITDLITKKQECEEYLRNMNIAQDYIDQITSKAETSVFNNRNFSYQEITSSSLFALLKYLLSKISEYSPKSQNSQLPNSNKNSLNIITSVTKLQSVLAELSSSYSPWPNTMMVSILKYFGVGVNNDLYNFQTPSNLSSIIKHKTWDYQIHNGNFDLSYYSCQLFHNLLTLSNIPNMSSELKLLYDLSDYNLDGRISREELSEGLGQMGIGVLSSTIDCLFRRIPSTSIVIQGIDYFSLLKLANIDVDIDNNISNRIPLTSEEKELILILKNMTYNGGSYGIILHEKLNISMLEFCIFIFTSLDKINSINRCNKWKIVSKCLEVFSTTLSDYYLAIKIKLTKENSMRISSDTINRDETIPSSTCISLKIGEFLIQSLSKDKKLLNSIIQTSVQLGVTAIQKSQFNLQQNSSISLKTVLKSSIKKVDYNNIFTKLREESIIPIDYPEGVESLLSREEKEELTHLSHQSITVLCNLFDFCSLLPSDNGEEAKEFHGELSVLDNQIKSIISNAMSLLLSDCDYSNVKYSHSSNMNVNSSFSSSYNQINCSYLTIITGMLFIPIKFVSNVSNLQINAAVLLTKIFNQMDHFLKSSHLGLSSFVDSIGLNNVPGFVSIICTIIESNNYPNAIAVMDLLLSIITIQPVTFSLLICVPKNQFDANNDGDKAEKNHMKYNAEPSQSAIINSIICLLSKVNELFNDHSNPLCTLIIVKLYKLITMFWKQSSHIRLRKAAEYLCQCKNFWDQMMLPLSIDLPKMPLDLNEITLESFENSIQEGLDIKEFLSKNRDPSNITMDVLNQVHILQSHAASFEFITRILMMSTKPCSDADSNKLIKEFRKKVEDKLIDLNVSKRTSYWIKNYMTADVDERLNSDVIKLSLSLGIDLSEIINLKSTYGTNNEHLNDYSSYNIDLLIVIVSNTLSNIRCNQQKYVSTKILSKSWLLLFSNVNKINQMNLLADAKLELFHSFRLFLELILYYIPEIQDQSTSSTVVNINYVPPLSPIVKKVGSMSPLTLSINSPVSETAQTQPTSKFMGDIRSFKILETIKDQLTNQVILNTCSGSTSLLFQVIAEKVELLVSMIHHQLKDVTLRAADPGKSKVQFKNSSELRMDQNKMEKILTEMSEFYEKFVVSHTIKDDNISIELLRSIIIYKRTIKLRILTSILLLLRGINSIIKEKQDNFTSDNNSPDWPEQYLSIFKSAQVSLEEELKYYRTHSSDSETSLVSISIKKANLLHSHSISQVCIHTMISAMPSDKKKTYNWIKEIKRLSNSINTTTSLITSKSSIFSSNIKLTKINAVPANMNKDNIPILLNLLIELGTNVADYANKAHDYRSWNIDTSSCINTSSKNPLATPSFKPDIKLDSNKEQSSAAIVFSGVLNVIYKAVDSNVLGLADLHETFILHHLSHSALLDSYRNILQCQPINKTATLMGYEVDGEISHIAESWQRTVDLFSLIISKIDLNDDSLVTVIFNYVKTFIKRYEFLLLLPIQTSTNVNDSRYSIRQLNLIQSSKILTLFILLFF